MPRLLTCGASKEKAMIKIGLRAVFGLFLLPLLCFAEDPIVPLRIEKPPIIDGVLDDAVWQNAPYVTGFKTWRPDFGIDMAEQTVGYLAYDQENLYFAFRCYDSEPDKVKTSITRRDNMRADDWICICIDPFHDQQGLYAFYINPMGIQGDSRFSGGVEDFGLDLVWHSAGQLNEEGYSIEVQIPFKSIRYPNKNPIEMGFIFERKISRKSENGTYPALKPAPGLSFFLTQMEPMRLRDIEHYTLFELLPAVTYGKTSSTNEGNLVSEGNQKDISLTTKYGLSTDLIFDATYNPDFSQVESDAGQVEQNLRFSLFFSEKRPFFLEGRENFNFAGSSSSDPLSAIVHTRQIVDPITGIKLSGKMGKKNTIATIYALDDLKTSGQPGGQYAHFAILRYKRSLNDDSYLGAVITGREREDAYNRVFGTDGQVRVNQYSILGYHLLGSRTLAPGTDNSENGHALGLDYVYQTRKFLVNAGFHDLSEDFQTESGYVTRTAISKFRASGGPIFYPGSKIIRRIDPRIYTTQTRDKPSDLYETDNEISLRFTLPRSSNVTMSYNYSTEIFMDERFNRDGWRISGSSQYSKQFYVSLSYRNNKLIRYISDPFQGRGKNLSATITLQPSDKFNADIRLTYADFFRDSNSEKIFDTTILRNRLTYQLNQYLFFRAILEHNSLNETLESDFLTSFTYIPGTVIHFGYGSLYEKIRWQNDDYVASNSFLETRRGFFAKASYLWRL